VDTSPAKASGLPVTALCELAGIALLLRLAVGLALPWLPPAILAILLFAYVPMLHYRGIGLPAWATTIGTPGRTASTLLGTALLGCVVYFLWLRLPLPAPLKPGPAPAIPRPLAFALFQAAIALSEEIFFRGYLHDAFTRHGRKPLLWTSFLFAAAHIAITPSAWRAMTFFPALLFGWSRDRTGNVYAPALLHLAFNLLPAFFGG
jgi:membrane protease YdiL (CAAX protease family)